MTKCTVKHTPYQPEVEDGSWHCPHCGATVDEGVYIDEPADGTANDCRKLHCADGVLCEGCNRFMSGTQFANALAKEANLVTCPHCKGKGVVAGEVKL